MFTKPIDEITFKDVESFCKEWPESVRVEYKQQLNIKKQIPKIVSSFANYYGGIFFIGVEANKTKNEVIFPIQGIPQRNGIEEQIQQSALTGIYPGVIPEIKLIDVPNSENVVVVVRVDESIQAPHAIQNSTRVYVRTGSITQPYELSDVDRISYMLKRREDSQVVVQQILTRIRSRAILDSLRNMSRLTVIAHPVFPHRPMISPPSIYELRYVLPAPLRRVDGGVSYVKPSEYLELNEYGVVYHGIGLCFVNEQEIDYDTFLPHIKNSIEHTINLYRKSEYLGNIEISIQLQDVSGKVLMDSDKRRYGRKITDNILECTKCVNREVSASKQCLSRDLENEEKQRDIVEELVCQLLWAFNIPTDQSQIRERVRNRIERELS